MILTVLKRMMERLGHEVWTFESEDEALEFYSANVNNIDLILLDIKLKRLTGREIFESIKQLNPKQKVVIISGFGLTLEIQEMLDHGLSGFLEKPFGFSELKSTLIKNA